MTDTGLAQRQARVLPPGLWYRLQPVSPYPHPAQRLGAARWASRCTHRTCGFNPHPAQRLGAARDDGRVPVVLAVSILTQHSGWVLPPRRPAAWSSTACFNPHPAQRLGAATRPRRQRRRRSRFNPHPAQRLGAAIGAVVDHVVVGVSILTQHSGWVLPGRIACAIDIHHVSILTQHSGWVLRVAAMEALLAEQFQSSPSTAAGCCLRAQRLQGQPGDVSILTQHSGWVLPRPHPAPRPTRQGFNPHPAQRLGAATRAEYLEWFKQFQSSPSTAAGCCARAGLDAVDDAIVSILTQHSGWVLLPVAGTW